MKRDLPNDPTQFIKEKLNEWACYSIDRVQSWASSPSFVNERVQSSISVRTTYYENAPNDMLWVSAVVKNTTTHAAENFASEDERLAATRRAIVRAAAEIWKVMQ